MAIIVGKTKKGKAKGYDYLQVDGKIKLFGRVASAVRFLNEYASKQEGMTIKFNRSDYEIMGMTFIDEKDASPKAQKMIFNARFS